MNVVSLFSGIGGLDLGLERAGMTVVAQSEIDPYACRVLAKHWPHVPNLGDITAIDWSSLDLGPIDLVCGGFPCQDVSQSGRRLGLAGARSGLWRELARAVRDLRPRYVLVENVGDLAVRGLPNVVGDLAALGYDAEWQCMEAAAFGAPHRRERIFIVAYPNGKARRRAGQAEPRSGAVPLGVGPAEPRRCRGAVAHTDGERPQGGRLPEGQQRPTESDVDGSGPRVFGTPPRPSSEWPAEPGVGRVADGVPARLDRLRTLGGAVVPQVAEWIGRRIMEAAS